MHIFSGDIDYFFVPPKGGDDMVTYTDLFQYTLVIVAIIGLIVATKRK